VNGATVAHYVSSRHDELLERGVDIVEEDIGDETVDACIDAGRLLPMHIAVRGNDIGQHPQISEPSCVGSIGSIAADALEVIALEIELLRLAQSGFRELSRASRNAGQNCSSFQREYDITQ
jgi:hypothetical protein